MSVAFLGIGADDTRTYRVDVKPDIAMVMICPRCHRQLEVTVEAIRECNYRQILVFLGEHSAHHADQVKRALDLDKVRAAVKLLQEAML